MHFIEEFLSKWKAGRRPNYRIDPALWTERRLFVVGPIQNFTRSEIRSAVEAAAKFTGQHLGTLVRTMVVRFRNICWHLRFRELYLRGQPIEATLIIEKLGHEICLNKSGCLDCEGRSQANNLLRSE
jgi:hypothetical protein